MLYIILCNQRMLNRSVILKWINIEEIDSYLSYLNIIVPIQYTTLTWHYRLELQKFDRSRKYKKNTCKTNHFQPIKISQCKWLQNEQKAFK